MQRVRVLLTTRPLAALWLVACVLAMRMLVPAGFMPVATGGGFALGLCPGTAPVATDPHAAMAGMHHDGGGHRDEPPAGASSPCAFAGAGVAAMAAPVVVLATVLLAFAPPRPVRFLRTPPTIAAARWRPPLRAPPFG